MRNYIKATIATFALTFAAVGCGGTDGEDGNGYTVHNCTCSAILCSGIEAEDQTLSGFCYDDAQQASNDAAEGLYEGLVEGGCAPDTSTGATCVCESTGEGC